VYVVTSSESVAAVVFELFFVYCRFLLFVRSCSDKPTVIIVMLSGFVIPRYQHYCGFILFSIFCGDLNISSNLVYSRQQLIELCYINSSNTMTFMVTWLF